MGSLIIIVDLATRALQQRIGEGAEMAAVLDAVDNVLNAIFFSVAGAAVLRETGLVRLGALAGLIAGTLDGAVVGAAIAIARPPDIPAEIGADALWLAALIQNAILGTILGAGAAWFSSLARRRSGP